MKRDVEERMREIRIRESLHDFTRECDSLWSVESSHQLVVHRPAEICADEIVRHRFGNSRRSALQCYRSQKRVRAVEKTHLSQTIRLDVSSENDPRISVGKLKRSAAIRRTLDCEQPIGLADGDERIAIAEDLLQVGAAF